MSILAFVGLLISVFVVAMALAILRAVIARRLNPLEDVDRSALPDVVRNEIDRIVPDFRADTVRLSKDGRQARLRGQRGAVSAWVKVDLDRAGAIDEFEFESTQEGSVQRSQIDSTDLPAVVAGEFNRLLGEIQHRVEAPRLSAGTLNGVGNYAMRASADGYEWEIEVDASGRLLEYEMEREKR